MCIKIEKTEKQLIVISEYNTKLPDKAKSLGGRWNSEKKAWIFDVRTYDEVKTLYESVYGYFDTTPDMVSIVCDVKNGALLYSCSPLTVYGRVVAQAYGRDSGAKTQPGVVVLSGGFCSGGSVKNWKTNYKDDTEFRLLDVPRALAERIVAKPSYWLSSVEIEEPKPLQSTTQVLHICEGGKSENVADQIACGFKFCPFCGKKYIQLVQGTDCYY